MPATAGIRASVDRRRRPPPVARSYDSLIAPPMGGEALTNQARSVNAHDNAAPEASRHVVALAAFARRRGAGGRARDTSMACVSGGRRASGTAGERGAAMPAGESVTRRNSAVINRHLTSENDCEADTTERSISFSRGVNGRV